MQRSCWFKVQSLRFKKKQAAGEIKVMQITQIKQIKAAELLVQSSKALTRVQSSRMSTEGSGTAGSRFKCANARSRFKEKQAADYKNFTQISQNSQIRQLLNLELGTLNLELAAPLPYLWAAFKP